MCVVQVHVSLGHTTVLAEPLFFGVPDGCGDSPAAALRSVLDRIGQLAINVNPLHFLLTPHNSHATHINYFNSRRLIIMHEFFCWSWCLLWITLMSLPRPASFASLMVRDESSNGGCSLKCMCIDVQ